MNSGWVFVLIVTIVGIYLGTVIQRPVSSLTDAIKCPFCYGIDLCKEVEDKRINLRYKSFSDFFYNVLSVKNLFFAEYNGKGVVLKKLGHRSELERVQRRTHGSCDSGSFKTCSKEVCDMFIQRVSPFFGLEQIWTILQVNVEPLILTLFPGGDWPVPKLLGACGFLIIEEDCGLSLNHFQTYPWHIRAFLAVQLLKAAIDFTHKHNDFRLYLTDISPDNIAVDDDFTVYFVDLESVILKQKLQDNDSIHYSEHFADEAFDFVYSEDEVCQSSISDHNVYAVCRLLLSKRAPWPMMPNGLLHSPPPGAYKELLSLVEECVDSKDRFHTAQELIRLLNELLNKVSGI